MARLLLPAVLLSLAFASACASPANSTINNNHAAAASSEFIRRSCRATQHPSVCVQSLSAYRSSPPPRSPQELARAALAVSVDRARAASAYVGRACGGGGGGGGGAKATRARAGPLRDCLENLADSVGHLRDAAKEMGGSMGRQGSPAFRWHLSNAQTWCSAALTDENTCVDGLDRGVDAATRAAIRAKVVDVAQVTSNALALVNRVGPGPY